MTVDLVFHEFGQRVDHGDDGGSAGVLGDLAQEKPIPDGAVIADVVKCPAVNFAGQSGIQ